MPEPQSVISKEHIVTVFIQNGLNQAASVQVLGNISGTNTGAVNVGTAISAVASGNAYQTFDALQTSGWLPYISVAVTCSTAPTSGAITVTLLYPYGYSQTIIVNNDSIRDTSTHTAANDAAISWTQWL